MAKVFPRIRQRLQHRGRACVVYARATEEGWAWVSYVPGDKRRRVPIGEGAKVPISELAEDNRAEWEAAQQ